MILQKSQKVFCFMIFYFGDFMPLLRILLMNKIFGGVFGTLEEIIENITRILR